jgi:hypothetical protein
MSMEYKMEMNIQQKPPENRIHWIMNNCCGFIIATVGSNCFGRGYDDGS